MDHDPSGILLPGHAQGKPDDPAFPGCKDCQAKQIQMVLKGSPLAVRVFGFATVFKAKFGYLPEGVSDEE